MPGLELTNLLASYGTVVLVLGCFGLLLAIALPSLVPAWKERLFSSYGLWIAFLLAAAASAVTLYYSEVLGQAPCAL